MEGLTVNMEKATIYGILANNKEVLVSALKDQVGELERGSVLFQPDLPLLKITMPPCGSTVIYRSFEEIPEESVPCSCGNPDHWFINYTDLNKGGDAT